MAIFNLTAVDNFEQVRAVSSRSVSQEAIATVKDLDEREEMEPWLQGILFDTNRKNSVRMAGLNRSVLNIRVNPCPSVV
jgi:hypothetical protein